MTLDLDLWPLNIWRFPYYINKPSLVQIGLQLFKWGHLHIFSPSYNLTSDDLWPWYMIFDCMNIWRFTYYIYKPSLVQISSFGPSVGKIIHYSVLKAPSQIPMQGHTQAALELATMQRHWIADTKILSAQPSSMLSQVCTRYAWNGICYLLMNISNCFWLKQTWYCIEQIWHFYS